MITKAEINLVRALADKAARKSSSLFVAEGAKLVGELLRSDWSIERLYATENFCTDPRMELVSQKEMERMSHLKTPSKALAVVRIPEYKLAETPGQKLTIALDGVQDPGNIGTIIRIADWFGIEDIICSADTADCFNPKVIQATMGAILRVRVHYTNLSATLKNAAQAGIPIYGTFLEGDDIYQSNLSSNGIIVMGSEGRGISDESAGVITQKLYIPPYPRGRESHSESLNVAVATSVVCSEFRRRG